MIEKNIKGSIIIGIAIIIAGLIAGGAIYSQKNNPPPKEEIDVRPTDFKKVAEASDKIKADDLEGATKLLVESYNERLQIVLKNRQTSKRLLKVYEDSLEAIERDEKLLARYLFEIGGIKIKQNKYAEANAYYTEANRLNSENSVYLNGLGLTCKLLGNFDEALEHYNTALDLDQKAYGENTDVARDINNIGGIWDAKGDYKKALEYYERAEAILLKSVGNKHPFMELVKGNIKSTREQLNTSTKEKPEKK